MKNISVIFIFCLAISSPAFAKTSGKKSSKKNKQVVSLNSVILNPALETSVLSTSNSAKETYELGFLPMKRHLSVSNSVQISGSDLLMTTNSKKYLSKESSSTSFEQGLTYGVSDQVHFKIVYAYQIDSSAKKTFGDGSSQNGKTDSSRGETGLTTPDFLLNYRYLPAVTNLDYADFWLKVSPKFNSKKSSTSNKEGNAVRGGDSYSLMTKIGKRLDDTNEWSFEAELGVEGTKRSIDAEKSSDVIETNSVTTLSAIGTYQRVLSEHFFASASLGFGFASSFEENNDYSNYVNNIEESQATLLGASLGMRITDSNIFKINWKQVSLSDQMIKQKNKKTNAETVLNSKDKSVSSVEFNYIFQI